MVICVEDSFQHGHFEFSVGGLGFGEWGYIGGVTVYQPEEVEPTTFEGCAGYFIGACGQVAKVNGKDQEKWGGAVTFGDGESWFLGLMYTPFDISPSGGRFLGWSWHW